MNKAFPIRRPVPRSKLRKLLRKSGWVMRNGSSHEVWTSPTGVSVALSYSKKIIGQPYLRQINAASGVSEARSRARRLATNVERTAE